MQTAFKIPDPVVRHEITVDGTLVVELTAAGESLGIRLAFDRSGLDCSTPLGGRRLTCTQAVEAIQWLGRDVKDCEITVDR